MAAPTPEVAPLAQAARRRALTRLVELARREKVQVVLLAGDVFHHPRPSLGAWLALQEALAAWTEAGARVFIAPGNHDPYTPESIWATWRPPAGVHVFTPRAEGVALAELGLWVAGAAHSGPEVTQDLAPTLPAPPPGLTGLALLHCDLPASRTSDVHLPYAPTRLENLLSAPFAYWALGHWHLPQLLHPAQPTVVMAGTPQGAHLDEDGPRGAWLAELDHGSVRARFLPLAPLVFFDLTLEDLAGLADPASLAERVRRQMQSRPCGTDYAACLRLRLQGPSPLWETLTGPEAEEAARALRDHLELAGLVLQTDGLTPPVDAQALTGQPHVLGRMLELIQQAQDSPQLLAELDQALEGKLHPLLEHLPPQERLDLLRQLLPQVRALALRHLWREESP